MRIIFFAIQSIFIGASLCIAQVSEPTQNPSTNLISLKETLIIDSNIFNSQNLEMVVKEGQGKFDNALAMNIPYTPLKKLRSVISRQIGRHLDFFRGWKPSGEAHVTVITPIEYFDILKGSSPDKTLITMQEIGDIADEFEIQNSDLTILGIGKGASQVDGITEETYFVIVESMNLRKIRQKIYELFLQKGGHPEVWNPQRFFPHITIGYTKRDLHEADKVLKNMENSFDSRFDVIVPTSPKLRSLLRHI